MDAAFLLVVALNERPLPPACRSLVGRRDLRLSEREPVDHFRWVAPGGWAVGAWQYDSGDPLDGTPWVATEAGVAMSTGILRWPGGPWLKRSLRAQRLLDAAADMPLDRVVGGLSGLYTALVARADGHAAVGADPLGLRFVYYGSNDDVFVVSTSATLAAQALAPDGASPPRDPLAVAWLAFSGYRIGDLTGYRGVHLLPQGATIMVRPGEGPAVETADDPWRPDEELSGLSFDDQIDLVRMEIADTLRAAAALSVPHRVVDLTGGKDSRLVLAVVLSEGLTDAFTFRTIGHDDLPDVVVAGELAELLGLRYSAEFPLHAERRSYVEQLRGFLDVSAGMTSISDLKPIRPFVTDEVQIAGAHGECLRLKDRFDHLPPARAELVDVVDSKFGFGSLRLLRRSVQEELRSTLRSALARCADESSDPLDAMQSFHLRHRARKRGGPLDELNPAARVLPLYSIEAIRAAFAMGGSARQQELLHFEIMKRASGVLVSHPFAGKGWAAGVVEGSPRARGSAPVGRHGKSTMGARRAEQGESRDLIARLTQDTFEQRRQTWIDVLHDRTNPAWEVIDRSTALTALEHFPSLGGKGRRELLGAITAALWLGGA